jgi:hypothetical protein
LRTINGTLRAAAPIRRRTGTRAGFAAHTAANDWKDCRATPRRGTAARADDATSRDAGAVGKLRPVEILSQACVPAPIRQFNAADRAALHGASALANLRLPIVGSACQRIPIAATRCLTTTSACTDWQRHFPGGY